MTYTRENAKTILDKIHSKGWNAYDRGEAPIDRDGVIRKGPATSLGLDVKYVMLPKVEDPKSPEKVMGALEKLAERLHGETPTITILGFTSSFVGFRLRATDVKTHTPEGSYLSYEYFIEALETIVQVE